MGAWDVGPFDNDDAADWCGDLHDAAPSERSGLIRDAFQLVIDTGDDYLEKDVAAAAIAAAAVTAAHLPGGRPVDSVYAPDFLRKGGTIEIPADVPPLGLRALDRVVGDDSEWRELWEESPACFAQAMASLEPLRAALGQAH